MNRMRKLLLYEPFSIYIGHLQLLMARKQVKKEKSKVPSEWMSGRRDGWIPRCHATVTALHHHLYQHQHQHQRHYHRPHSIANENENGDVLHKMRISNLQFDSMVKIKVITHVALHCIALRWAKHWMCMFCVVFVVVVGAIFWLCFVACN